MPLFYLAPGDDRDLIAELLADKRSACSSRYAYGMLRNSAAVRSTALGVTLSLNTRRAYAQDLKYFFQSVAKAEPTPQLVAQFLTMPRNAALSLVLKYKQELMARGLAEATINRRLAALRALVDHARRCFYPKFLQTNSCKQIPVSKY